MNTHVTRPRTSLCFVKISGFHVKLSTRNRVHSPANSLSRCTPSSHRAGGESCSTPHHPMRVNLPIVIYTTTGMSKNTFQKSLPKTPFIILLPLHKNKSARELSQRKQDSATRYKYYNNCSRIHSFHTQTFPPRTFFP